MERLNLNLPSDARQTLRRMARSARRREGEYARELLLGAISAAERDEFFRQAAAAQTPELRRRELELAHALEKLHGQAR
ncbi:MAG: hypothetical protein HY744_15280 [Deltaproteobacteria bacterium]|nr:hypothetical protein [Deltaproteobacteria bacterium]